MECATNLFFWCFFLAIFSDENNYTPSVYVDSDMRITGIYILFQTLYLMLYFLTIFSDENNKSLSVSVDMPMFNGNTFRSFFLMLYYFFWPFFQIREKGSSLVLWICLCLSVIMLLFCWDFWKVLYIYCRMRAIWGILNGNAKMYNIVNISDNPFLD